MSVIEAELRTCREALERAVADRDSLQRQTASHLLELDRLRQEKESLEIQQRVAERDLLDLRDKVAISSRSLVSATDNIASQETSICQLRGMFSTQPERVF
jgi:chromosome segregation ATPase